MKQLGFILFIVIASLGVVQAQQVGPNISWDNDTHDFGDIKEDGGKVTYNFSFTNTGNAPLVITQVRPSCGCTTSDYTKEPVMPGQKGFVSAVFNPMNRPHRFSKSISITTNSNPPTSTLRIVGNVIPKQLTVEDEYPRVLGELRLKSNHLALMKVSVDEVKEGELEMVNTSSKLLNVSFRNVPAHIKAEAVPETLKPGEKGVIKVWYDAKKKNDWGFLMDRITVAINGDTQQNKNLLSISANIEEDFSDLSEAEKAKAPKIEFNENTFNFGTITQGQSVDYIFEFKNTGKSDLIIRKTKASCGCTVINPSKSLLKPGETAELKVKFDSTGKLNRQNKSITVITNDPSQPQVTLRVTGMVEPASGS
ncbi:MAG: DUF1573 domain-containing protein [Salinivirgaceae bacterium]